MEIIKKSANITSADLYALTKGSDVRRMADAKGEILDLTKYVLYKDEDNNGNESVILAVETVAGVRYATNSKTFIRGFTDILAIFEASGEEIPTRYAVNSSRSKNGREYLTCDIAR